MLIIPAVDIKDNCCVRLVQGKAEDKEVFSIDACEIAKQWEDQGAKLLHVVDLDGAFQGKPVHHSLIKKIVQTIKIPIQVGGGIRNEDTIKQYLDCGIQRVIIGTFLLNQGNKQIESIIQKYGEQIVAGIDIKDNRIAIEGWLREADQLVEPFITYLTEIGIKRFIYTDINRDGMLSGPNVEMIKKILQKNQIKLIASGGISTVEDLDRLQKMESMGLEGVIIGKALYKRKVNLQEAIQKFQELR